MVFGRNGNSFVCSIAFYTSFFKFLFQTEKSLWGSFIHLYLFIYTVIKYSTFGFITPAGASLVQFFLKSGWFFNCQLLTFWLLQFCLKFLPKEKVPRQRDLLCNFIEKMWLYNNSPQCHFAVTVSQFLKQFSILSVESLRFFL